MSTAVRSDPVAIAREAAEQLLAGAAAADDPTVGVQRTTLRDLADRGLFSVRVPVSRGGLGGTEEQAAEVEALLAGADAATWFVLTQHRYTQRLTGEPAPGETPGPAAARYADGLASGELLGGIALAHLRRPGTPAVRATPDGSGWRFTGHAAWCTGWGLDDVVLIAGLEPETDTVVFALLPAEPRPGLTASEPMSLAVMGGTHTVALDLDLAVAADEVAATMPAALWHRRDAGTVVDTKPATLGLLDRVLAETDRTGRDRERSDAVTTAAALRAEADPLRARAEELRGRGDADVDERIALRGRIAELTVRAAGALIAARGGSALLLSSPEQRWGREAMFHLVQAQTDAVRAAQLAAFAGDQPH